MLEDSIIIPKKKLRNVIIILFVVVSFGVIPTFFISGIQFGYSHPIDARTIEVTTMYSTSPEKYTYLYNTWIYNNNSIPYEVPENCCVAILQIKTDSNVALQINISENYRDQNEEWWNWTYLVVALTSYAGEYWYSIGPSGNTLRIEDPSFENVWDFDYRPTLNSNYSYSEKYEIIMIFFGYRLYTETWFDDPFMKHTLYITTLHKE